VAAIANLPFWPMSRQPKREPTASSIVRPTCAVALARTTSHSRAMIIDGKAPSEIIHQPESRLPASAREMLKLGLQAALLLIASTLMVAAAEIDGVIMPDAQDVAGTRLVLNGAAVRTYSFLRIHIYVAGLYLERRSADAEEIMASDQSKLLRFSFERRIDAEDARKAWREDFDKNCRPPCHLSAETTDRFLAAVPSVQKGDIGTMVFTGRGLDILLNEKLIGQVSDPGFIRVILSTFIGAYPVTAALKRGLLGAPG
jgi:hypothetical protein